MVLTISTNTAAINVQRNLNKANEASASSLAKLSSGSRVPTAKDDAASLAIGSRVESEIAGLKQASTNASQATSLLQIADGAMGEINDILIRQSTLAIQSSSGQLSDTERAIIDSEFQELTSEVTRIAEDTEFNGNQLLNGGDVTKTVDEFTAGGLATSGIEVELDPGLADANGIYEVTYDQNAEELTLTNRGTGEILKQDITAALDAKTGAGQDLTADETIDVDFAGTGVKLTLNKDFVRGNVIATVGAAPAGAANAGALALGDAAAASTLKSLPINDSAYDAASGTLEIAVDATGFIGTAGSELKLSTDGGVTSTALDGTVGPVAIAADSSYTILDKDDNVVAVINTESTNFAIADATGTIDFDASALTNSFVAADTTSSTSSFDFRVGTGTQTQDNINVSVSSVTASTLGTSASSVATKSDAEAAITTTKAAIDTLLGSRAQIGASLSRLDFASSNISVAIENQSAAKSGLLDVDVATESTEFAAQQVIVQAGVSLLAQANQRPSQLMKLIG
ncbi:MAG: hypothetical protein GY793_04905 [Proteobacteria bacterium]|nr:hypothetical protein [Pseudomonadota bacterium]